MASNGFQFNFWFFLVEFWNNIIDIANLSEQTLRYIMYFLVYSVGARSEYFQTEKQEFWQMHHVDNFTIYIILLMHLSLTREGILFSIMNPDPSDLSKAPPNISFLEVLCEFTNKLMKQDKKTV